MLFKFWRYQNQLYMKLYPFHYCTVLKFSGKKASNNSTDNSNPSECAFEMEHCHEMHIAFFSNFVLC